MIHPRDWLVQKITRTKLASFIEAQATDERTLDLGSSWSPYASYFPNRVTCDAAPGDGVDVVADAHDLPFKDGEFKVVLCSEVLEHLHTPECAIGEMHRVLAPGGTLILTTRFMFPIHEAPVDYFRYTEFGLRHLLREWEIVEFVSESANLETIAVLVHRMAMTMKFRGGVVTQAVFFLLAKLLRRCTFLVRREYRTLSRSGEHMEGNTFASGYYLVAKKNEVTF